MLLVYSGRFYCQLCPQSLVSEINWGAHLCSLKLCDLGKFLKLNHRAQDWFVSSLCGFFVCLFVLFSFCFYGVFLSRISTSSICFLPAYLSLLMSSA